MQRPEPGNRVIDQPGGDVPVDDRGKVTDENPFLIIGEHLVNELTHLRRVPHGIERTPPDELSDLVLHERCRVQPTAACHRHGNRCSSGFRLFPPR